MTGLMPKLSVIALAGGMAVTISAPSAGSYVLAGSAPRVVQIEAFAASGGRLDVHVEVLRGRTAQPPVVRLTVAGHKAKATREALGGNEGPRYRVDYSKRFARSGNAFRAGKATRVTVQACTATCTTVSKAVTIEPSYDR